MMIRPLLAALALLLAIQPAQALPALSPDQVTSLRLPDDCRIEPEDLEIHVRCRESDEECGILAHTTCWTVRFACFYTEYQFEQLHVRCHTQPGCCQEDAAAARPVAPGAASGTVATDASSGQCTSRNYGVRNDLNVLNTGCQGPCENYGVWTEATVAGTTQCSECSNTGIEVRVGPTCRGPLAGACVGTECVAPCSTCPGLSSTTSSSGFLDCLVVVQAPSVASSCDPCDERTNPVLVVGVVSCHHNCVNEGVQATVGLYDCGACGKEGITAFVGQHCDEWGLGACLGYCCFRPVSSSGQPLYDPCFMGPARSFP